MLIEVDQLNTFTFDHHRPLSIFESLINDFDGIKNTCLCRYDLMGPTKVTCEINYKDYNCIAPIFQLSKHLRGPSKVTCEINYKN